MNFLAHIFLSRDEPKRMLGNFLGDLIRPKELPLLAPRVAEGVRLHRAIDSFTDAHPIVRQAAHRIMPVHHKYAPVIVDIWYDHLLVLHWELVSPEESFPDFRARAYALLDAHFHLIPERLQPRIRAMIAADWLRQYSHTTGLEDTFRRLAPRTSRPELLQGVQVTLEQNLPLLMEEFPLFWADLSSFVKTWEPPVSL